ncbi:MAG: asparagine synthase (glutamine-hydrolyzing) [SAR324 cluster bacterium]|nr:asparagine synthase (glutamine-hydrolyzing) [SAR324 cluster bacterium]
MCGICGFVTRNAPQLDLEHLRRMNEMMIHRGPDEGGDFSDGKVFMAMRRLSIIDLAQGHQPMFSPDKTLCVVFNGEIYNYRELQQELQQQGYDFTTESDTETLLHGYHAWGMEGLLARLNGMFGFCLYDTARKQLFLARDRAGEKPVYYYKNSEYFVFASELKALTQSGSIPCSIDQDALAAYLLHQFTPGSQTLLAGVSKLPPGSFLRLSPETLDYQVVSYWELSQTNTESQLSLQEHQHKLFELLKDSIKIRLRADVPVGAFLSGGLDSSINVALIASLGITDLNTFSIGFEHQDFDESPYSRQVADHFGTKHHHFLLNPRELTTLLPQVLAMVDEPVADAASIPTYWLCQESRKIVKVALTGEGADELFAGYDYYREQPVLPLRASQKTWKQKIKQFFRKKPFPLDLQGIPDPVSGFPLMAPPETIAQLLASDNDPGLLLQKLHQRVTENFQIFPNHALARAQYYDIKTWLPDDLLMKVDKMSMANSLEVRAPFLDHRLIEYSFTLPDTLKIQGNDVKFILRKSFADLLPPAILKREKHGFNLPMHLWLRAELKDLVMDTLNPETLGREGVLNAREVNAVLEQFMNHDAPCERLIYSLYVFQQWWHTLKSSN